MSCPAEVIVQQTSCNVVTVITAGPQGIQGPMGNPGPQGAAGTGGNFPNLVSAIMAAGSQDYGSAPPSGYVTGVTNQLDLTPNSAGSTLVGLLGAPTNGFAIAIYNASATAQITLSHRVAGSAANQFTLPSGVSWVIPPFKTQIIVYINGAGWTVT